jgi:hypothetical protein
MITGDAEVDLFIVALVSFGFLCAGFGIGERVGWRDCMREVKRIFG